MLISLKYNTYKNHLEESNYLLNFLMQNIAQINNYEYFEYGFIWCISRF